MNRGSGPPGVGRDHGTQGFNEAPIHESGKSHTRIHFPILAR